MSLLLLLLPVADYDDDSDFKYTKEPYRGFIPMILRTLWDEHPGSRRQQQHGSEGPGKQEEAAAFWERDWEFRALGCWFVGFYGSVFAENLFPLARVQGPGFKDSERYVGFWVRGDPSEQIF